MEMSKSLINPQEAVKLFGWASTEAIACGIEIFREYEKQRPSDPMYYILGCIWNAGHIQGLREERSRLGSGRV